MKTLTLETLPGEIATLLQDLKERQINLVLLKGDLGCGKTTSVQALAKLLGVAGSVQSPTFVLMKEYETTDSVFRSLVHIDAYRITDGTLFSFLKLETLLADTTKLICVEWPEQIPELSHFSHALVQLEYHSDSERTIDISFVSSKV